MNTLTKWFGGLLLAALLMGLGAVLAVALPKHFAAHGDHDDSHGAERGSTTTQSKQNWTCGMHPQVVQDHPGICPICHMKLTPMRSNGSDTAANDSGKKKVLYWWDPMLGPSSIADKPGKSAMGMDRVPVYESDMSAGPKVTIDPTIVQNMGVRTAQVSRGPLDLTIRAVGMLKVPEPGLHDVSLKVNGWIDKLYADTEGMHIEKDQPLFELYSPDLQVAEEELIGAVKALKAMDANAGEAAKREADGLVESAKRKLRLWDVAEQDIEAIAKADRPPRTVIFRSPAHGHIVEKMVVQGSAVQAGMKLMRIEDHSKLWLDAEVYQEQLPVIAIGQEVEATIEGLPGTTFTGKVSFLHPHVDHMTRTLTVRTILENPKLELRPGMYATAKITTRAVADALLVPKEAVIDTGTRQIAFVADGEGHFDPRKVRTGLSGDGEKLQILEGLAPDEMVVTSGQFLMDVESRTTEAIEKLRKSSPAAKTGAGAAEMGNMNMTPATAPAAAGGSPTLVVANCPMKKADWIQRGDSIENPYYGTTMSTCGSVTRKLAAPADNPALAAVVNAYLTVQHQLNADMLDSKSIEAMKKAADELLADRYPALRDATTKLAQAKDLTSVRVAFKVESAELITAVEQSKK